MRSPGRARRAVRPLSVAVVLACLAAPAPAFGATLGNGVYTAGPNEGNVIQVTHEPDRASYRFRVAAEVTDTDGPGGCSVVGYDASCPASAISRIVVNTSDRVGLSNYVSIGTNGFVPPMGLSEANQVRIPVEVHGGSGSDIVAGGWGSDVLDGGAGSDLIDGVEGSYLNTTPETQIQARDLISCGTGNDIGGTGFAFMDTAQVGPGDVVASDCEAVEQMVKCPRSGPDCLVLAPVEARLSFGAAAAGGRASGGKSVLLGVGKKKLQSGQSSPVTTRLNAKRVRAVLRRAKRVRAVSSALAKRQGERKLLDRTRFRLSRAG